MVIYLASNQMQRKIKSTWKINFERRKLKLRNNSQTQKLISFSILEVVIAVKNSACSELSKEKLAKRKKLVELAENYSETVELLSQPFHFILMGKFEVFSFLFLVFSVNLTFC